MRRSFYRWLLQARQPLVEAGSSGNWTISRQGSDGSFSMLTDFQCGSSGSSGSSDRQLVPDPVFAESSSASPQHFARPGRSRNAKAQGGAVWLSTENNHGHVVPPAFEQSMQGFLSDRFRGHYSLTPTWIADVHFNTYGRGQHATERRG